MPPRKAEPTSCSHKQLQLEPSAYAEEAGFEWLPAANRLAAETKSGRKAPRDRSTHSSTDQAYDAQLATFPGPLVSELDQKTNIIC